MIYYYEVLTSMWKCRNTNVAYQQPQRYKHKKQMLPPNLLPTVEAVPMSVNFLVYLTGSHCLKAHTLLLTKNNKKLLFMMLFPHIL
jgi:hypothetical protein